MLTLAFLLPKIELSLPQKRELNRLLTNLPVDCVVHGGETGATEYVDYLAYRKGLYRRAYWPGWTSPERCGLFVRKGRIEFMRPKPDPQRMLYVIGDGDLVIACPGSGGIGRLTQEALDRNKPTLIIGFRGGWTEAFNGADELLEGRD